MNKKLLAFASSLMLVFGGSLLVKAQSGMTDNWQNVPNQGRCQSSIRPPSYYCSIPTDDGSLLTIYVTLQPDGSFTNGSISKGAEYCYNGQCAPSFSANNWSGSNLSGTFSGVTPQGVAFSGSATEVLGQVKYCAGKYGCHLATGIVSGSGVVIFQ